MKVKSNKRNCLYELKNFIIYTIKFNQRWDHSYYNPWQLKNSLIEVIELWFYIKTSNGMNLSLYKIKIE